VELLDDAGRWHGGYLDQTVVPGTVRVRVQVQATIRSARDQFFVRPRDLRMVLAYTRAFGPTRVLRKIRSRQSESVRNDAWLSIGSGWAEEADGDVAVAFVATSAPKGVERIVVPRELVRPLEQPPLAGAPRHHIGGVDVRRDLGDVAAEELDALAGWQPEEGTAPVLSPATWTRIGAVLADPPSGWTAAPPRPAASAVRERAEAGVLPTDRPHYHVFGFGQYAKVNAIANLDLRLHLAGIHEINPAQLGPVPIEPGPALDTSPTPRDDEQIRNAVLAGYHHTHGPLAVQLLDRGARHVVIEKPLTTTGGQLDDLLAAMDRNPDARVHAAFQRRHAPFNRLVRKDLGHGPISMAATVYEVPLPARHWYRWPVVGNSVVSNGCHWIDYFLHLNDYADVVDHRAVVLPNQVLLVLELASGASCAISLRHEGSPRLGVRDLITLWRGDATVTIEDNCRYRSEQGFGRSRSASCARLQSHEDMYVEFARRIQEDDRGDSRRSIEVSTRAMVRLAELVDAAGRSAAAAPSAATTGAGT
jgi:predicted dehydrogenase